MSLSRLSYYSVMIFEFFQDLKNEQHIPFAPVVINMLYLPIYKQ